MLPETKTNLEAINFNLILLKTKQFAEGMLIWFDAY